MFSLDELQNTKATLKTRGTREAEPETSRAEQDDSLNFGNYSTILLPDRGDTKARSRPLALSCQALALARGSLQRRSVATPTSFQTTRPETLQLTQADDEVALLAFANRRELFEKQVTLVSKYFNDIHLPFLGLGD